MEPYAVRTCTLAFTAMITVPSLAMDANAAAEQKSCSLTDNSITNAEVCAAAAILAYQHGDYRNAEPLLRKVYEVELVQLGAERRDTLTSLNNLARVIGDQGRYAEAEKLDRQVANARTRVLGAEHPYTLASLYNLALDIGKQGRYVEVEPLAVEVVVTQIAPSEGNSNPNTIRYRANLGYLRAHYLHKHEQGYPDLKAAANGVWLLHAETLSGGAMGGSGGLEVSQAAARQILQSNQGIFVGQIDAAWDWSHQQ